MLAPTAHTPSVHHRWPQGEHRSVQSGAYLELSATRRCVTTLTQRNGGEVEWLILNVEILDKELSKSEGGQIDSRSPANSNFDLPETLVFTKSKILYLL